MPSIQKAGVDEEGHTVIAFGYKKHSGKDQAGEYLVDDGYEKRAFASAIKEGIGKGVFGLSDEQCYGDEKGTEDEYWRVSPGELFQVAGTDLFRKGLQEHFPDKFNGQIWARAECRELIERQNRGQYGKYVFTDLRFPDEAEFLREHFGATCVQVSCPQELREERSGEDLRSDDHDSEVALDGWDEWDYTIDNTGSLKDLKRCVRIIRSLEEGDQVPLGRDLLLIPPELEIHDRSNLKLRR